MGRLHAEIQDHLVSSGLAHTLLRPASYVNNLFYAAKSVATQNNWSGAAPTGRVAYIDIRDLSEAAALVLREPALHGTALGPARERGLGMIAQPRWLRRPRPRHRMRRRRRARPAVRPAARHDGGQSEGEMADREDRSEQAGALMNLRERRETSQRSENVAPKPTPPTTPPFELTNYSQPPAMNWIGSSPGCSRMPNTA